MNLYDYHEMVNARRSNDLRAFRAAELAGLTQRRTGSALKDIRSWPGCFGRRASSRNETPATGRTSSAAR
jgi:hypothetical protein